MSSPEHPARDLPAGTWHPVSAVDVPGEGRVRSVTVDGRSIALTRCGATLGALQNHCPHQGGPLGEGSIEKGCDMSSPTAAATCRWYLAPGQRGGRAG